MRSFALCIAYFLVPIASVSVGSFAFAQIPTPASHSPERQEIEAKLQDKSRELQEINKQIESTQRDLNTVQKQKTGLQRELKLIDTNIKGLTLNIRSDEVVIGKLGLEIDSLESDMADIQKSIGTKESATAEVLRVLEKEGSANLFMAFLKGKSLADGVFEAQSLKNMHLQLTVDIQDLQKLHSDYDQKLQTRNMKKNQISYHKRNLSSQKEIVEDQQQERKNLLIQTKNKESIYQSTVADLIKKQSAIAAEIEDLDKKLRAKINAGTLPTARPGVLGFPVSVGKTGITQEYGATSFAKYGYRGKWHNGLDFGVPIGTPIFAAEDGVIAATGNQDKYCPRGAYGKFIVVNHTNNLTTLYGHLSQIAVSVGETVSRGQVIGYAGKTGYATGPHLHFTVYARDTFVMGGSKSCGAMPQGGDINPLNYL